MNILKEFKVNEFLSLRLVEVKGVKKTYIYVNDELFNYCNFLLINIPVDDITSFDEIESVDEAAEKLNIRKSESYEYQIPPETQFWGHCSNLQA